MPGRGDRAIGNARIDAQLRRVAARTTKTIADRFGERIGIWYGAGYPRSGTTWLCQLMSSYLDIPFVRRYRLPVLMPCVVHSHWLPGRRLPPTIYVVRDGRDVLVSRYFFEARAVVAPRNPRGGRMRRERFDRLYGPSVDLHDVRGNLARFVEDELTDPQLTGVNWAQHVARWLARPEAAIVRYEQLRADTVEALAPAFEQLTGQPADRDLLRLAAERFDFARQQPLAAADGGLLLRSGAVGDWRRYFTAEATEIFARHAGAQLRELGYPAD